MSQRNQDYYPFSDDQQGQGFDEYSDQTDKHSVFQNLNFDGSTSGDVYGDTQVPNYIDGYEHLYQGYESPESYQSVDDAKSSYAYDQGQTHFVQNEYVTGDEAGESFAEDQDAVNETDVISLLNRVENIILNARSMPFSSHVLVDREELVNLITMARDYLPEELHRARWLIEQNQQVIEESKRMAESIIRQAERRGATMINEHEITLQARQLATQTVDAANASARQIRDGALDYAGRRLSVLEEQLTAMLVTIQKNKKELK